MLPLCCSLAVTRTPPGIRPKFVREIKSQRERHAGMGVPAEENASSRAPGTMAVSREDLQRDRVPRVELLDRFPRQSVKK
jgi:hypothetical protein